MNARQKRFCDEYLISGNAEDSALKAGYRPSTAKNAACWINQKTNEKAEKRGYKSLYKPELREYIDEQLEIMHDEKTADANEVIEYLTSVMRGEQTDEVLRMSGKGEQEPYRIDVPAKDRLKAAELLGKRYGIFTEKIRNEGAFPVTIVSDLPNDDTELEDE